MRLYTGERTIALAVLSGWMILSLAHAAPAAEMELRRSVEVRGATIRLSDLLPADASIPLRELATGVVLGSSPQPGSRRILQGEVIRQSILPLLKSGVEIQVPEQIAVTRGFRRISSEEILHAILAAVQEKESRAADLIRAADLELQAPVLITNDNPDVQVVRMDYDRAREKTRFVLRLKDEPSILPFCVLVALRIPLPASSDGKDSFSGERPGEADMRQKDNPKGLKSSPSAEFPSQLPPHELPAPRKESPHQAKLQALAEAGKPATMLMDGPSFRITTTVVPLQRGAEGQKIRVRSVATGRVLEAIVTGAGMLRAAFPEGDFRQ